MIRAYTTNETHAAALRAAAQAKSYEVEIEAAVDVAELGASVDRFQLLVFDLTVAALSAESVMRALDALDPDRVPPVLYLLSTPADIALIAQTGSIINQDYSFVPIHPPNLADRLEVLNMLGARRKLTMESAITDRLTGLYNRKYFIRRLEEELYRSARYQYNLGSLLAEVDFTSPKGKLSEQAADDVMREIATFFKERLRKSDIIARYKWDNFAFLLPDITPEDAMLVAHDVKAKLEALAVQSAGQRLALSVSVGLVCFPVEGLGTAVEVIGALEDACLKAKSEAGGVAAHA